VICNRTTREALEVIKSLVERFPGLIVVHSQRLPFLGGALREAFELARSHHPGFSLAGGWVVHWLRSAKASSQPYFSVGLLDPVRRAPHRHDFRIPHLSYPYYPEHRLGGDPAS